MPKTPEGKAVSSRNAYKHGAKSAETLAIRSWLKGLRIIAHQLQYPANATGWGHQKHGGENTLKRMSL